MNSTTPYIHFRGSCRAAISFYRECFGGELEVMAYPDAAGNPNPDANAPVMHSKLAQGGQALLMASDYPPGTDASGQGNNFSVYIDCSSDGELERLFTALSRGGKVTVPPSDMPFGRFCMCDDSFGVSWILNSAKAG
ncbi:MAG: VOC family protein [Acidobacteria bacterium]|nr:VOC family protein [Acidobacteriota bacterium]